jgi:hypothetical protein
MQPGTNENKKKKWLVIAAIALAAPIFGIVMWGFLVGFSAEPSDEERAMLPTVEDLGLIDGQGRSGGTYAKTRYIDGTWMVEYEYEDPGLYMYASIDRENTERDARTVFAAQSAGAAVALRIAGEVETVDDSSLYSGGDQRECERLVFGGATSGYMVTVRQKKDIVSLFVSGVVYDDAPTVMADLIDPMLDAL